MIREMDV